MFSQTSFFCMRWKVRTLRAWGHQLSIWLSPVEMNRKLYDALKQDNCTESWTMARALARARLSLTPQVLQEGSEGRASEREMLPGCPALPDCPQHLIESKRDRV